MSEQQENSDIEIQNDENNALPELYSKTLILLFSIFFSTVFAAFLLMSNLRTLEKKRARYIVLAFALVWTIASGIILQLSKLEPSYTLIFNVIGAAILNEFFWNKYIGSDREYDRKSWIKPTLISLLIVLVFFFLFLGSLGA